jgi:hypothetical protein
MELQQAKLLRAVYSERRLLEAMADFWFNPWLFPCQNNCAIRTPSSDSWPRAGEYVRKYKMGPTKRKAVDMPGSDAAVEPW